MMDKQINKIPLVRFPEFKEGWEHKQLNELLSVSKTKNLNLIYSKEDVLSVSGESGIVNQIEHLGRSYAGVSVHNYSVVEVGQIVYTKSPLKANPYGIIKLNNHKAGIVSTLYAVYFVNEKTDGQFIEHYFSLDANLNRYLRPLVRKGAKNDMKISNEYVLNDRIFSPQLKEQKKIASFLTSVDNKINLLTKKKALLETYKKGVMQKIFSQEIRFKDEEGNDYPDWEEKKLEEFLKYYDGTHQTPKYIEKGIPFYSVEHITANQFVKTKYISEEVFNKENERVKLEKGDILMTRIGDIGTSRLIDWDVNASFYVSLALLKQNLTYSSFYLNQFIKSEMFQKELWSKIIHVAFPKKINLREIGKCRALLPSLDEQKKIANFLTSLDSKIELVNTQIEKTKAFKKGLLQQMFV